MWTRRTRSSSSVGARFHLRTGTLRFFLSVLLIAGILPAIGAVAEQNAYRKGFNPDAWRQFPNVVALDLEPEYLQELLDGARQRGRHWERPGKVAFYRNGDLRFESPVGIRIHGGVSRFAMTKQQSFRLYFRQTLEGKSAPGDDIGLDRARPHKILVVHGDERNAKGAPDWHYASPIAYAIAGRLGVSTPEIAPATLVLNGAPGRPYVLTEYLDMDFVEAHFGHRNFDFFANRTSDGGPKPGEGPLADLQRRFGAPEKWTFEQVREVVDVENLTAWFLTVLYCGSKDFTQGRLVRDRSHRGAKWFWVAWDFDDSFGRSDPADDPWHSDPFAEVMTSGNPDPRFVILSNLFTNSESFRRYFAERFVTVRDSLLTPDFFDQTLSRYEDVGRLNGITDTTYQVRIRDYLAKRPAILREQLMQKLHVDIP